jgi:hypothetical protein
MSKPKPLLALKTKQGELTMPLSRAIWITWRASTYPIIIAAAGYIWGGEGALIAVGLLILTFKGEI